MAKITFKTSFDIYNNLLFSPQDIKDSYLFGVDILDNRVKNMGETEIKFFIQAAQKEVENYLNLKLVKQKYTDKLQFTQSEWRNWGYIKTTYPVRCPLSVKGYVGTVKQVDYPTSWLAIKNNGDENLAHKAIYLVPVATSSTMSQNAVYSGILPQLGYSNLDTIPYYWEVVYVTGFDNVPADIMNAIGKFAAINLLLIAGDLALGQPGITNKSISIDGLSQSLGSALSGSSSAFGGRIKTYVEEFSRSIQSLKDFYCGINFSVA